MDLSVGAFFIRFEDIIVYVGSMSQFKDMAQVLSLGARAGVSEPIFHVIPGSAARTVVVSVATVPEGSKVNVTTHQLGFTLLGTYAKCGRYGVTVNPPMYWISPAATVLALGPPSSL